jgi:hypothetical protein
VLRIRRRPARSIEIPVAALADPMALVTALSAGRLAAGLPVAYWSHDQVDRQLIAADDLLRALEPDDITDRTAE